MARRGDPEPLDLHVVHKNRPLKTVRVECRRDDPGALKRHLLDVMWNENKHLEKYADEYEMTVTEADTDPRRYGFTFKL